jgi:purine-binding chemotaxis protein CheW
VARAAASDKAKRMLIFRVGKDRFGVPASLVREVVRLPRVSRVPHAPASLIGLGNFRGAVLPVISFASLTDRKAQSEGRVILLDTASPLALAVDEVMALGQDADARAMDIEALIARDFSGGGRRARVAVQVAEAQATEAESHVVLVAFTVSGQDYALPITAVQEVLRLPSDIALLPHADATVVGSIAVRDALLPLLSLAALLALPGSSDGGRARVVVVKIGAHRVGLVVDRMSAILRVPEAQIDPVPAVLARGSAETRIQAICRLDEGRRLVSVLAIEHLIREDITVRLLQGAEEKMAEQEAAETSEQFLLFRIGDEEFGLPIDAVVEVARPPAKLTRLPKAPTFVQGVMSLRGQVIPVIDQSRRFGGAATAGARRRVIIVRLGAMQAGFAVDAASEVMRVPASAIRPAPDLGGEETRVFDRIANLEDAGRMVLIVSPQELLDRAESELLAGLGGKPATSS